MKKDFLLFQKLQPVLRTQNDRHALENNVYVNLIYSLLLSSIFFLLLFIIEDITISKLRIVFNCTYLFNNELHLVLTIVLLVCVGYFYFDLINYVNVHALNIFFSLCFGSSLFHLFYRIKGDCISDYLNFFNIFWFNISDILINAGFIGIIILYFYKRKKD